MSAPICRHPRTVPQFPTHGTAASPRHTSHIAEMGQHLGIFERRCSPVYNPNFKAQLIGLGVTNKHALHRAGESIIL